MAHNRWMGSVRIGAVALGVAWQVAGCGGGEKPANADEESSGAGGTSSGDGDGSGGTSSGDGDDVGSGGASSGDGDGMATGGSPADSLADPSLGLPGPFGKGTLRVYDDGAVEARFLFRESDEYVGCTAELTEGWCTVWDCPDLAADPTPTGATTVQVQSGTETASLVVNGSISTALPALQAGDLVTFSAEPGEIPGYTASLIYPGGFELLSPPAINRLVSVDPNSDLSLTWQGGGASTITFQAFSDSVGGRSKSLLCYFPASVGAGLVLSSALLQREPNLEVRLS